MHTGLDIATYQKSLNIEALPAEGISVVIHKASGANGGSLYVDSGYRQMVPRIRAAGMVVGHYFFNGPVEAVKSADFFVDNLSGYTPDDILALDVEAEGLQGTGWAESWFLRVKSRLPKAKLFLYTTQGYVRSWDWKAVIDLGVGLWIAAPGTSSPYTGQWNGWSIHQYSWTGKFAGYQPLDTNYVKDSVIQGTNQGDDMYDDKAQAALYRELAFLRPVGLYQWGTGLIWVGPGGKEWVVPNNDYVILADYLKVSHSSPIAITDGMHDFLTKQLLPSLNPSPANAQIERILKLSEAEAAQMAREIEKGV